MNFSFARAEMLARRRGISVREACRIMALSGERKRKQAAATVKRALPPPPRPVGGYYWERD